MSVLVGALGTSHSPQVSTPAPVWFDHGRRDRASTLIDFASLAQRDMPWLEGQLTLEVFERKFAACQAAILRLREEYLRLAPDVVVVVGDDQREMFLEEIPMFAVFRAEVMTDIPRPLERLHNSQLAGEWAYHGGAPVERPTHPALATHILTQLVEDGFDMSQVLRQPEGRTIGHAFTFVHRRIMIDDVVPIVPVMVNCDHLPNLPSIQRSWQLGEALRRAVDSWPGDERVLLVASGGLSHFKIDEALDRTILSALADRDLAALRKLPREEIDVLGTGEIRNWVAVGAAMSGASFEVIDYVPCYRSEAGTGCAMAFARWKV